MTTKPHKPLLVNLTWAGVLLAAALTTYVGSFGVACWMCGRNTIGEVTLAQLQGTVYMPLTEWSDTSLPCGRAMARFADWCYLRGEGVPVAWSDVASRHFPRP